MAATEQDIKSGKASRWYRPELEINEKTREILEEYSGISPDQVLPHVHAIVGFPTLNIVAVAG